ncbi:metallophosphoesterase [candidate division FCPU426 bacterium]|nr:metallophosphoesterase [candidate division FCPU426 bacterium]
MIIAHLSDLHIARFGIRMTDLHHGRNRLAAGTGWLPYKEKNGWRIDFRKAHRRARLYDAYRLVDVNNCVHKTVKIKGGRSKRTALDHLQRLWDLRINCSSDRLLQDFPDYKEAVNLLRLDPENGNLRFCVLAHVLRRQRPDWLVITGDLTDDGEGYGLIRLGFEPFIANKRLVCIPGNHDIYPSPAVWNSPPFVKSSLEKKTLWRRFQNSIGFTDPQQLVVNLGEGIVLACLDSCHPSRIPFSASGWIPLEQVDKLSAQLALCDPKAGRLACMHHPISKNGLTSYLPGMRLRNAKKIFSRLNKLKFQIVMCGHQHFGYQLQPAKGPMALSAPSTIFGCRSGAQPFYWLLEVAQSTIQTIHGSPIPQFACL